LPDRLVGAVAAGRSGKAAMLNRHVSKQLSKVPARAGRRFRQVVGGDGRDHVNRGQYGDAV
jgi:hypothetical protein